MDKHEQHTYLMYLIRELEKAEDKRALDDFITVAQDLLKVRYKLHRLFDYPISAADYDELITFAENLLGVNRFGSADDPHYDHILGRTNDATSVESAKDNSVYVNSAKSIDEKLNNMMAYNDQIITDAIVDYALDDWQPDEIDSILAATKQDPSTLKSWDQVKQELDDYHYYWSNGRDIHFFYNDEFVRAWNCADDKHKKLYYWPYNNQFIVGTVNPIEWYKTKGDELPWGPIFGPFESAAKFDDWYLMFWNWWGRLDETSKHNYHMIPERNGNWIAYGTDYERLLNDYNFYDADYKGEMDFDYDAIADRAKNDEYSKMTEEDYRKFYSGQEFTKEWKAKVVDMVEDILYLEREMKHHDNEFDGERLHDLEQKLLDFLKRTL